MDIKKVRPEITKYLSKLKNKISIAEVLLYGSYATNTAREDSDVDLLVISKDFKNMGDDKRIEVLYTNSLGFPYDLHVYGLTPSEYLTASPLTSLGAIRTSKTIKIM